MFFFLFLFFFFSFCCGLPRGVGEMAVSEIAEFSNRVTEEESHGRAKEPEGSARLGTKAEPLPPHRSWKKGMVAQVGRLDAKMRQPDGQLAG